jgi:TonB family protein
LKPNGLRSGLIAAFLCLALSITAPASTKNATTPVIGSNVPDWVVEYKWPSYPYIARTKQFDGQGRFRMYIDWETGNVTSVSILKSTTHKILDDAAIAALLKWKFKPHFSRAADVPVTFAIEGKKLSEARRLAVYAVEPDQAVTFHRGSGVFRFIIDYETGQVTDVKIIKSTGRVSFDIAVVKAYRQWRFLPHKVRAIDTTVGFSP